MIKADVGPAYTILNPPSKLTVRKRKPDKANPLRETRFQSPFPVHTQAAGHAGCRLLRQSMSHLSQSGKNTRQRVGLQEIGFSTSTASDEKVVLHSTIYNEAWLFCHQQTFSNSRWKPSFVSLARPRCFQLLHPQPQFARLRHHEGPR